MGRTRQAIFHSLLPGGYILGLRKQGKGMLVINYWKEIIFTMHSRDYILSSHSLDSWSLLVICTLLHYISFLVPARDLFLIFPFLFSSRVPQTKPNVCGTR